jgi:DNA-binding MarR family transcriptional regulator
MSREDPGERLERQVLRLTDQIEKLAAQVAAVPLRSRPDGPQSTTTNPVELSAAKSRETRDLLRRPRAPLPDPRLVGRILRQRRLRRRYFQAELFADPAWDILLELTAARAEHRRVSVTSLCIAADVPATTALRWIVEMTDMGMLVREPDKEDKRRAFIALSEGVARAMARFFDELGADAATMI